MTTPHLTVRASGYGGRGYADIFSTEEKPKPVPGVTTVLGALDKPGILQWSMNNMAAHATMHAQDLLDKSEEQSYKSLQYYVGRMKESDFDDPVRDLRNSSNGVLNDLAELGTLVHDWIECYLTGSELPEVTRPEQAQMINAFLAWAEEHEIEVYATEATVYGQGYAGTADAFWSVDGVKLLDDHKGLPLDTKLPTPAGWTTMGEIRVGDRVFDEDGNPTQVTHKSDVHHNPCVELTFDSGSPVICDTDHRWVVHTGLAGNMKREVLTAGGLLTRGVVGKYGQQDLRVKNAGALELPEEDLHLDPYVLGVWLGDGTGTKNELNINDDSKRRIPEMCADRGWELTEVVYPSDEQRESAGVRYRFGNAGVFSHGGASDFKKALQRLGVIGGKHLPLQYLRASFNQRLDLLRGLMDTDGSWNIARNGECNLVTTDESMIEQYEELIASLGWKTSKSTGATKWTHNGVEKYGTAHRVTFRPMGFSPFLAREYPYEIKEARNQRAAHRMITGVRKVETVETQCIAVDSPVETYLFGNEMRVTHNTSRALRDEHFAQLGALGAAHTMAVECLPGETDSVEYKGKWFRPEPLPAFTGYSVLHLRPDEYNNQGEFVPAYCELVVIPNEVIDAGFELFKAALAARHGQRSLKEARKKVGFNA